MTNKKTLGIIGLVVLGVAAAVLIYRDTRTSKIEITGAGVDALKDYGVSTAGGGKIEIVPIEEHKLPPAPSLDRSTVYTNTLSVEAKKIVLASIESDINAIKKNPGDITSWIDLGIQRKVLGDYEGARDAWEYAKTLAPADIVAWHNLGDLYHSYLKDYVKSEENWKKTIALKPDYVFGYRGLYELYTYSMKEKTSEIPVILKQGIAAIPEATDLKALLAEYEKSVAK